MRTPCLRSRFARILLPLLTCISCIQVELAPLQNDQIIETIHGRALSEEVVARALLACPYEPLPPLGLDLAERQGTSSRLALARAAAAAWNPSLRRLRREVQEARAAAGGAGHSLEIEFGAEEVGSTNGDFAAELGLSINLLEFLGGPRSSAARALADARTRVAVGAYEQALWETLGEVDGASLALDLEAGLARDLLALQSEAAGDANRRRAWAARGWISALAHAVATSTELDLEAQIQTQNLRVADARLALATVLGVSTEDPALLTPESAVERGHVSLLPSEKGPNPRLLLLHHPRLRALHFEYALAEAELEVLAQATWPALRVGPRLNHDSESSLLGSMVEVSFPDLRQGPADVLAGVERRHAMREQLEDALQDSLNQIEIGRARSRTLSALEGADDALDLATTASWRAARAQFAADPSEVDRWAMELERRREALSAVAERRRARALATVDFQVASGPKSASETAVAGGTP